MGGGGGGGEGGGGEEAAADLEPSRRFSEETFMIGLTRLPEDVVVGNAEVEEARIAARSSALVVRLVGSTRTASSRSRSPEIFFCKERSSRSTMSSLPNGSPPRPKSFSSRFFFCSPFFRSLSFSFSILFSSFSISFHRLARSSREISPFSHMLKRDCSPTLRCNRAVTSISFRVFVSDDEDAEDEDGDECVRADAEERSGKAM
jgi:hypothetical protein